MKSSDSENEDNFSGWSHLKTNKTFDGSELIIDFIIFFKDF